MSWVPDKNSAVVGMDYSQYLFGAAAETAFQVMCIWPGRTAHSDFVYYLSIVNNSDAVDRNNDNRRSKKK